MKKTMLTMLSLALSAPLCADGFDAGVTLNPQIGYYGFDSKRNIEDESFIGLGVGYQFANPWAIEFNYLTLETDPDNSLFNLDVDYDQIRFDGLYHLSDDETFRPYLAAGIGHGEFDAGAFDAKETQLNLGGGVKYFFNRNVSLRGDARAFYGFDDETVDFALTLGLNLWLGQTSSSPSKPSTAAPIVMAEKDSDGDGVLDGADKCPTTPANTTVDSDGCIPDSDNDGVADNIDQCPDSSAGAKVDAKGCYEMLTETRTININVKFPNDSAVIPSEYRSEVEAVATFMTEYPQTSVVVEGHTDDRGAAQYNQQLSERRAKAVADMLASDFNIAPGRISHVGKGETYPIADNGTVEGRAANRRVVGVVKTTVETRAK
ncbi:OmpA family protein [Aurantivibrio plasticivorans]